MDVAIGLKAHTGWAVLVVLGDPRHDWVVVDRRRIQLVDDDAPWAKQPYHAAESLSMPAARELVQRSISTVQRRTLSELRSALERTRASGDQLKACALVAGAPMPAWSLEEIIAVHVRMHKAEGALFREALVHAATGCGVPMVEVAEKRLVDRAVSALGVSAARLTQALAALGKRAGPPWGADQKAAALAAIVALCGE